MNNYANIKSTSYVTVLGLFQFPGFLAVLISDLWCSAVISNAAASHVSTYYCFGLGSKMCENYMRFLSRNQKDTPITSRSFKIFFENWQEMNGKLTFLFSSWIELPRNTALVYEMTNININVFIDSSRPYWYQLKCIFLTYK
jgi:hypothetical protein